MLAPRDRLHHFADVDAVLDHRVAGPVVAQGDLVADRNFAFGGDLDVLVVLHDPAVQRLAGADAFDDHDAYAVAFFMHDEMNHACSVISLEGQPLFYSHARSPTLPAGARRARREPGAARARPAEREAALRCRSVQPRRRLRLSRAGRLRAVDAPCAVSR